MSSSKWGYKQGNCNITQIRGLITPFTTTHEPPSKGPEDPISRYSGLG